MLSLIVGRKRIVTRYPLQDYQKNHCIILETNGFSRGVTGSRFHMADEIAWGQNKEVYVRGEVKHQDHQTKKLNTWYRVYKNSEIENKMKGAKWID